MGFDDPGVVRVEGVKQGAKGRAGEESTLDTPTRPKDRSLCETLEYILKKRPELGVLIDELKLEFV